MIFIWFSKNHLLVVWDDSNLQEESGMVPKPNWVVGGSIPGYEFVSLLDEKLVKCFMCSKIKIN